MAAHRLPSPSPCNDGAAHDEFPDRLLALKAAGQRLPPLGAQWLPLLVLGVLTAAIPYATIAWGQLHIESGLAGIIFGTIPVFSILLAPLIAGDEKYEAGRLVGTAVGLAGVVLVIGPNTKSR